MSLMRTFLLFFPLKGMTTTFDLNREQNEREREFASFASFVAINLLISFCLSLSEDVFIKCFISATFYAALVDLFFLSAEDGKQRAKQSERDS